MSATMTITEGVPLPQFPNASPQNVAARTHKSQYSVGTFGAAGEFLNIGSNAVTRCGGADEQAAAVGSRGFKDGVHTFAFQIERTRNNDGLGLFLGVADASVDFQNRTEWGKAYAIGCHGQNLFSWENGLGAASLERGALEGSEDSIENGSVVRIRVDMDKKELAFAVDSGDYQVAKGVVLPEFVRPFCKLAGFNGDKVAMAYEGDDASLVTDMHSLPRFKYGVPQNAASLRFGVQYRPRTFGPHGPNVRVADDESAIRLGGDDERAAFVGARGTQSGQATYTFRIDRTQSDDGLGVFVGVADAAADFLNEANWGSAWALGCHGGNLFQWEDGFGKGELVRGALPGSAESLKDGAIIKIRVDMDARSLGFSVDGSDFVVAKGLTLPDAVRPFCKLAGSAGDCVSLAYEGGALPQLTAADKQTIEVVASGNPKLPRVSSDTVLCGMLA